MIRIESLKPLDDYYGGGGEGTPIARFYINRYMKAIAPTISGLVLEFGRPTYGQYCDCMSEIIDIDVENKQAHIHADICETGAFERYANRYDFVFCTAVLQLVSDPRAAVVNLRSMLKPGGRLILAEKAISRLDPDIPDIDRWRFTQHGVALLMEGFSEVEIFPFGNVYATCAYLYGIPAEKIAIEKLDFLDTMHPIITIANGKK